MFSRPGSRVRRDTKGVVKVLTTDGRAYVLVTTSTSWKTQTDPGGKERISDVLKWVGSVGDFSVSSGG